MTTLVSYFAAAFMMVGLITLVQPRLAQNFLKQHAFSPVFRNFAVAGRFILGIVFILVADGSRYPLIFNLIGVIALFAGIFVAVIPKATFTKVALRSARLNANLVRIGGAGATAMGVFMAYAVL